MSETNETPPVFRQELPTRKPLDLTGKQVTVVGLARTGRAAIRFLLARGAHVSATDLKTQADLPKEVAELKELGVDLELGRHSTDRWMQSDLILLSPGVPLSLEPVEQARAKGIPVLSEVELASQFLQGRVVGITGSNGKTTVTTLVGELLSGAGFFSQVGGNIGRPLISLVDLSREDGFTVVELSSFQLELTDRFRAHIAVFTNVSPDHLDRHETMGAYVRAKQRIFRNQTTADWAILNADDPIVSRMADGSRARILHFSRFQEPDEGVFVRDEKVVSRIDGQERELMPISGVPLRGTHNLENVLASLAVGLAADADPLNMAKTVRDFRGVEHRLEWVARIGGADYYNDSKATNVDSTVKALEAFPGNILLIAGGRDKGGDFSALRPIVGARVKSLILIGEAADKISRALQETAPEHRASTMIDAVRLARQLAVAGDVVLLAPACASFDMFEDFEHRGRVFKEFVRAMAAETPVEKRS